MLIPIHAHIHTCICDMKLEENYLGRRWDPEEIGRKDNKGIQV